MGEPVTTQSVISQALSGAGASEPQEPAPAPAAAPAAPVAPSVTPQEPQPGPSVDPLVDRLRALGVSANDLDQIRRHYEGFSKAREATPPEPVNHWRLTADEIMDRVDPSERGDHEEYRRKFGDEAYVAAVHRMEAEARARADAEPEPEPSDDQKAMREEIARQVQAALAPYERPLRETARERARSKLHQDATPILDGMKVPQHAREYLLGDIEREVARAISSGTRLSLQALVSERWEALRPVLDSHGKVTTDGLKASTRPAGAPAIQAPQEGARLREPDTSGETTVAGRLGSAFKAAFESSPPEGAA